MTEYVSLGISIVVATIAAIGIFQTRKSIKISSNQFLFDRRSEVISLYKAIVSTKSMLHFSDFTDNEEFYSDIFKYEERSKNLLSIIKMEFASVTDHALLYELFELCESVNTDRFIKERRKFLLFKNDLNEKKDSIDYLFSSKELRQTLFDVLNKYEKLLQLYSSVYYQIDKINSHESIRVLLLSYKKLSDEGNSLKNTLENLEIQKIESMIKKELTVF
ncbi:hypothetical protein [Enterococcus sp. AZ101]|uniref:hypothetical protein n=1 Tax=Enterococcus sp. AZ101 TaxID=2774742 RepID=UPI003D2CD628